MRKSLILSRSPRPRSAPGRPSSRPRRPPGAPAVRHAASCSGSVVRSASPHRPGGAPRARRSAGTRRGCRLRRARRGEDASDRQERTRGTGADAHLAPSPTRRPSQQWDGTLRHDADRRATRPEPSARTPWSRWSTRGSRCTCAAAARRVAGARDLPRARPGALPVAAADPVGPVHERVLLLDPRPRHHPPRAATVPTGQETLWYGWSRTAAPDSLTSSNWCALHFDDYGADGEIPDSPKLGDTKDFGLIGVNVFGPDTDPRLPYLRSDLVAFPKPASGAHGDAVPAARRCTGCRTCRRRATWDGAVDGAGVPAFAPVPVTQTDPSSSGYVVATDFNGSSSAPYYGFNPSGRAVPRQRARGLPRHEGRRRRAAGRRPVSIPVTSYLWPRNAFQQGINLRLDTQEGAPTQAMSGVDPVHPTPGSESGAIWTQQVVRGGGGAMITWYELDPTAPRVPGVADGERDEPVLVAVQRRDLLGPPGDDGCHRHGDVRATTAVPWSSATTCRAARPGSPSR